MLELLFLALIWKHRDLIREMLKEEDEEYVFKPFDGIEIEQKK